MWGKIRGHYFCPWSIFFSDGDQVFFRTLIKFFQIFTDFRSIFLHFYGPSARLRIEEMYIFMYRLVKYFQNLACPRSIFPKKRSIKKIDHCLIPKKKLKKEARAALQQRPLFYEF